MHIPTLFMLADPWYFEDPGRLRDAATQFSTTSADPPRGWVRATRGPWVQWAPQQVRLPAQGWKVHVATRLADAESTLRIVTDHCVGHGIPFKFLRSRPVLLVSNEKYADRGSSGKFITLYPRDDGELQQVLVELDDALAGRCGPYILSDLRWREGPLYVRWGGFSAQHCHDGTGDLVPAVRGPDGTLVPDVRGPRFDVPPWVRAPEPIARAAREASGVAAPQWPYRVQSALHFSNAGGVYLAVDSRDGRQVVLREARPLAGLDGSGCDALERLDREFAVLGSLQDLTCVPRLIERRQEWEHHFLVEEFVEGMTLQECLADRYPFIYPDVSPEEVAEYAAWADQVAHRVEQAVREVHAKGFVLGDLHPGNVIVRPDGRIVLIDFEQSSSSQEEFSPALGDPRFTHPAVRHGVAVDEYAMACLRLGLLAPLTGMLRLDPRSAAHLLHEAAQFPVPPAYVERILEGLALAGPLAGHLRRATPGHRRRGEGPVTPPRRRRRSGPRSARAPPRTARTGCSPGTLRSSTTPTPGGTSPTAPRGSSTPWPPAPWPGRNARSTWTGCAAACVSGPRRAAASGRACTGSPTCWPNSVTSPRPST